MELFQTADFWHFIFRLIHFVVGITWIGMLYYFNFVQTPFFKSADGAVRSGMIRGLVPNALWWFRWGAMFTFITGLVMLYIMAHQQGEPMFGKKMTFILTGALMGTLMWANVWFVIWPAQKVVIASAEQVAAGGEAIPEAAALGAKAGMASRTNTLFSFPMLFCMGAASHLTIVRGEGSLMGYWLTMGGIIAVVEINGLIKPGAASQKMLTSVKGVIHASLLLTVVTFLVAFYMF